MSGRLVVVSNRLPLTLRGSSAGWVGERSAGGLVTALEPVMSRRGGIWLGWPGEGPDRADAGRQAALRSWERERGFAAVDLPKTLATRFYQGYANQVLWPLFHQFPSRLEYHPEGWTAYVEANQRFRDAVMARLEPGDVVWVHDYHLMLLPRMLRESAPDLAIGFFLHIPFPASDVFRILPRREEMLAGVLGADYVAFQTHGHLQHFRSSLLRILGISSEMGRVLVDGRAVRLDALPIGIAPETFVGLLEKDRSVRASREALCRRFEGRRLLLAVDRLDYTKGIPERLRAYRRLLEGAPELRGQIVLVQVAVPTRERISRYRELKAEVNGLVGEINGDFGTPDWTPVVYIRRSVSRAELVALYAASDVGWVTPLRDGMNLVAKEYVACQRGGEGVLVLSEFAGAAAEMGEAVLVNPYDEERTAAAVERALALPAEDRRERMAALFGRVSRMNAFAWAERFTGNLEQAAAAREAQRFGLPPPLALKEAVAAFRASRSPILLFDYDGTLVPYASRPRDAQPPEHLAPLLARLASGVGRRVALVSGRARADIERWLGQVDGLWLAAEHGAVVRPPGGEEWQALRPSLPLDWKGRVLPVLEHFVDRTPGSLIEEKEYSLVWHFRMSDPEVGEWLANELVGTLEELLAETELRAVRGHKSIEVRLTWANKGEVVRHMETAGPEADFRLALGDDRTDEDLFAALPRDAWTIHVGPGDSSARFHLAGPDEVRHLLEALAGEPVPRKRAAPAENFAVRPS
jgi:trehalose 6-phosphate synthase/phosphatase